MGQKHRVDMIDVGIDQLLAQIGRSVDDDGGLAVLRGSLDQQRTAPATIFRICRIALAPAERRAWHTRRGAAAHDGQRQRHALSGRGTLENRRKKFSVVCRDNSSNEMPRASASTFATSTT